MINPRKFFNELIIAFTTGLAAGLLISVFYNTLETVLLSVAVGATIAVILLFYNLIFLYDDFNDLLDALSKGSVISTILWAAGFFGSLVGSAIIN